MADGSFVRSLESRSLRFVIVVTFCGAKCSPFRPTCHHHEGILPRGIHLSFFPNFSENNQSFVVQPLLTGGRVYLSII